LLAPIFTKAEEIQEVYAANCANCHGLDGRGNTPLGRASRIPNLRSSEIGSLLSTDLATIIGKGANNGKMPAFRKKLGPKLVEQLAAYIQGLKDQPEPVAAVPSKLKAVADVKAVYSSNCAHCHGVDGSGATVLGRELKLPDLRAPEAQKLSDSELVEVIAHGTPGGHMAGFRKKLSAEMVEQVASYVRELQGRGPIDRWSSLITDERESRGNMKSGAAQTSPAPATSQSRPSQSPSNPLANSDDRSPETSVAAVGPPGALTKLVDLNSASKETLMELPGLTERDAENIIKERPYRSTLQFKIRGVISPELYGRIADRIIAKHVPKSRSPREGQERESGR
jgi:mono/diheme cytochrome c family protein/DNA uptake protein ComE-like DNA-binding protein